MTGRALLGTTSFEHVAGSEIVLIELAEALIARGWECDLTAFDIAQPVRRIGARAGIRFLPKPAVVRPLTYDLVWLQTQIGPVLDFAPGEDQRARTLIAFAHLDLRWKLAGAGILLEDLAADRFMFPSPEAAAHFGAQGLHGAPVHIFHNAAPKTFARPAGAPRGMLSRLMIVSNHLPEELAAAAAILKGRGIAVTHWGSAGDTRHARLSPEHLDETDAVVTIGKTVQYALLGRVPVYIYDQFGGPGWLDPGNFEAAAHANFSGRCCRRTLAAEAIAGEVESGFEAAAQAAATWPDERLDPYRLDPHVDRLLHAVPAAALVEDRLRILAASSRTLSRERDLAAAAGHYFAAWRRAVRG